MLIDGALYHYHFAIHSFQPLENYAAWKLFWGSRNTSKTHDKRVMCAQLDTNQVQLINASAMLVEEEFDTSLF